MEHYRVMNRHGRLLYYWIPACAGMTVSGPRMAVRNFVLERFVMLVKTSIQWLIISRRRWLFDWVHACAGMAVGGAGMTVSDTGMMVSDFGALNSLFPHAFRVAN